MTVRCILGARFSMTAEVLRYNIDDTPPPDSPGSGGTWITNQDPITGEIITRWEPGIADDPDTPDVDESVDHVIIPCMVEGIYNSGIRAAGSDEDFGEEYFNTEFIKMWIPGNIRITKRDRVTNIKDSKGVPMFLDEEYMDRPTVYNVQGVTPRTDPFGKMVDQFVFLKKAA